MTLRLPVVSSTRLGLEPDGVVRRVEEFLADPAATGYLLAEVDSVTHLLFLLHGKTFCAGKFKDHRFEAVAIARFFAEMPRATRIELCTTDLPLFLCTAVMFRKAPAAQIPLRLVDSARLLGHVEQMGKDAVLVVRRGDARSLVFCHEGRPHRMYPAVGEVFPEADSVADRIVEYVYSGETGDLLLDLYDEIRLPPANDAGHSVKSYREPSAIPLGPQPVLVVHLGERVVFRYPIFGKELSVGRGGGNDLSLDNLSVSRQHAHVTQRGRRLLFEDLGSENGLVVDGRRVRKADLGVGDEVLIGKYLVRYEELSPGQSVNEIPSAAVADVPAIDETIAIPTYPTIGVLEHKGREIRIGGLMFSIGKKPECHVRVRGFFVAGVHARIHRHRDGTYILEHLAGRARVKVNGAATRQHSLAPGDEISIRRETFRFHLIPV